MVRKKFDIEVENHPNNTSILLKQYSYINRIFQLNHIKHTKINDEKIH